MSIGGLGASQLQYGGPLNQADTEAAASAGASAPAEQAAGAAPATQSAASQTAPASAGTAGGEGQAMGVWQALQNDPQGQLLQQDLLSEERGATGAGAPEGTGVGEGTTSGRSDDAVLDDLDEVWDQQDDLYDELDQLTEGSGTSSVEGMTPAEIEARMGEIQEELDFLYAYEDLLVDELGDPDTGFFDSFWTEWDLWDVKFDIADLETEMADLQGAALDWSVDDLWSQFATGFGASIDDVMDHLDWEGSHAGTELDKSAARGDEAVKDQMLLQRERLAARIRRSEDASRVARATTTVTRKSSTRPELTDALPKRLRGIRKLAVDLANAPTETARARLQVATRLVRGERPEIARGSAD